MSIHFLKGCSVDGGGDVDGSKIAIHSGACLPAYNNISQTSWAFANILYTFRSLGERKRVTAVVDMGNR
jgi:hypothetical protein